MNDKKLINLLVATVEKLDQLVTELEEGGINVSFFYERGHMGHFTDNKSDRIALASIVEFRTLYDVKSNTNRIKDDETTKV